VCVESCVLCALTNNPWQRPFISLDLLVGESDFALQLHLNY